MSSLPKIDHNTKIGIICEGFEEWYYLDRLLKLNVWDNSYTITPINAKGESSVFAKYQEAYANDNYELVLIFCDTDAKPFRQYEILKKKVNDFHACDAFSIIAIYANPCSMQIILSHFGDVELSHQGKKTNANIIEQFTGIKGYDAHENQIKDICNMIFMRTYDPMKERISKLNKGEYNPASTNLIEFLGKFESSDKKWIKDVNDFLN